MRRLIVVVLILALILLAGCASEIDPDEAYSFGYEDGYSKGYKEGYAEGLADGAASHASTQLVPDDTPSCDYVLNKNSKKFHYPWCSSVDDMAEKNKVYFDGTRSEAIAKGYVPCKRCNP